MSGYILAVDQGTSSSKAIIIDQNARIVAVSENVSMTPHYPQAGWVEYQPEEILSSVIQACRSVLNKANIAPQEIACVALANQGETVIAFDRDSGASIYPAISWQDKRSVEIVEQWKADGKEEFIREVTGLIPDPYFSASKMHWILKNVPEARDLYQQDRLCLATSDTWLIYHLLAEKGFFTDVSTASRAMLLNLRSRQWDENLLQVCSIPRSVLPEIVANDTIIGSLDKRIFGVEIPLGGLCVDQQAALFGQRCFDEGAMKITYGTGCFMLANVGQNPDLRAKGLLTSVGWQIDDVTSYVFDGGIYNAGALVRWLTQQVKLASTIQDIEKIINSKKDAGGVYFIPALTGLAAPYWQPEMSGSWHGLKITNDNSDLLRSAIESIAFRVKDVFDSMESAGIQIDCVYADGGLSQSHFLMQLQADLLNVPIDVFKHSEATALGVGLLAGMPAFGWSLSKQSFPPPETSYQRFEPNTENHQHYSQHYTEWKRLLLRDIGRI